MKKAKATNKAATRKAGKVAAPAKKHTHKAKKEIDLVQVRKDITQIVGHAARDMTRAVVSDGLKGQLAAVKYLFEVSGLYPTTPATEGRPEEDSLARTLLNHLGLPAKEAGSGDAAVNGGGKDDVGAQGTSEGELNPETKSDEAEAVDAGKADSGSSLSG